MSTSIKDVGSAFASLYSGSVKSSGSVSGSSFQQVWNSQFGKSDKFVKDESNTYRETESGIKKATGGQDAALRKERVAEKNPEPVEENDALEHEDVKLSKEELEKAMEVLGTTAMELMQQIADSFGVSMEELQAAMDALGMSTTDVLDALELEALMLNLGGASDAYALVTDEALYGNYRMLMDAQKAALEELANELGVDADQLSEMIMKGMQDESSMQIAEPDVGDGVIIEVSEEAAAGSAENDSKNATSEQTAGGENGNFTAEQNVAFVTQNTTTDYLQAQVQQTEGSSPWSEQTQNIMRQIMDSMKVQVNAETTDIEMQLHPASLGTVRVNIASNAGVITASFVAQNEAVKTALESQMVQLQEAFAEQGVKVEAIEVTVQTHQFEQNLEQGRGRNGQESSDRRNRTRRINLNDPIELETMEEEDVLAAEMMTAGGSTVDYTA